MGFRPLPDRVEEGSLIWYEPANQTQVKVYVNALDGFLESKLAPTFCKSFLRLIQFGSIADYIDAKTLPNRGQNQITCGFDSPPGPGQVCALDVSKWAPCTSEEGYGYARSSPCVFLKLNRVSLADFLDLQRHLPCLVSSSDLRLVPPIL
jgi:sodium/potassium-transporting ATPase subunit beta